MLPGHLLDENSREDPEKLEDKDKMGKNMRDFVILMGCQDVVKNAKLQTSYRVEDVRKRNKSKQEKTELKKAEYILID